MSTLGKKVPTLLRLRASFVAASEHYTNRRGLSAIPERPKKVRRVHPPQPLFSCSPFTLLPFTPPLRPSSDFLIGSWGRGGTSSPEISRWLAGGSLASWPLWQFLVLVVGIKSDSLSALAKSSLPSCKCSCYFICRRARLACRQLGLVVVGSA